MALCGIAKSRVHAVNLMITCVIEKIIRKVNFWEELREFVEDLKKFNYMIYVNV